MSSPRRTAPRSVWTAVAALVLLAGPASAPGTAAAADSADSAATAEVTATAAAGLQRRTLTISLSTGVAQVGQSGVRADGRLAQGGARKIVLQVRKAGSWVVRAATTSRAGAYRVGLPTAAAGSFDYRVVAPVTAAQQAAGLTRATSAVRTLKVVRPSSDTQRRSTALGDATDFSYLTKTRARWNPCSTITYRVNTAHGPASALRDAQGAAARIEDATGLDLEYVGPTKLVPQDSAADNYPADTQIVIAWASAAQSALIAGKDVAGVGGPMGWGGTVDEDGADILTWRRGTVVLNSALNGQLDAGFGRGATVGKLLMHEIAHVVGLGHAAGDTQVMYPTLQREHPTAWGAGDLAGLRSQGASQGCIYEKDGSAPAFRKADVSEVSQVNVDSLRTHH